MTVAELAAQFGVSTDTIRRDLDRLDSAGLVIRTHGGAVSPDSLPKPDTGLEVRRRVRADAKDVIGRLAAGLVRSGSTAIINSGTTTLAVARHLRDRHDLTIATNNLLLPGELPPECCRNLYMLGGTVKPNDWATIGRVAFVGPEAGADVAVRADLALIGVGGVTLDGGYCTSNIAEAAMMREMMGSANEVVVLVDSSKFSRQLFAHFAPLGTADYLVTDAMPDARYVTALSDHGVTLVTPESTG